MFIIIATTIACNSAKKDCSSCNGEDHLITKIDSINNYYIIYTKLNDENYKLVSEKKTSKCKKKVVVGKKYHLVTESIFSIKIKDKDTIRVINNNINIKCISLGDTEICKDYEMGIYDVFTSENLQGLCYINKK